MNLAEVPVRLIVAQTFGLGGRGLGTTARFGKGNGNGNEIGYRNSPAMPTSRWQAA